MSSPPAPHPGRAPTRPDGELSRTRILDAAERLLSERGYAGTSIASISRESGLPASSIYWFFESKQDLTAGVIERAAERFLDGLGESHRDGAPEERLQRLMQRALGASGHRLPDFLRLELLLGLERDPAPAAVPQRVRSRSERARALFEDAVSGVLSPLGAERAAPLARELAPLAMSFIRGALISEQMDPGSVDLDRLSEEMGAALLAIAKHRLVRRGE
ncbi:MAG: TetR/AcrR family transcriptional regulator [Myxococcota bacterium]|nr:TetR/AcrR family transcriptional regulator [Myxococcota bacterium]